MWTITEKQYTNEDGESYTGYGVEFGKCLVEDITPSRTAIQQFADALNRFDASPVHIYEIIENYLAELCGLPPSVHKKTARFPRRAVFLSYIIRVRLAQNDYQVYQGA